MSCCAASCAADSEHLARRRGRRGAAACGVSLRVEFTPGVPHCLSDETPATITADQVRRFIFENQPVRGHWVHLEGAWRELRAHANYPPAVTELLGQAVVASVLLAATLKFRGTLTFQLEGDGAVSLLVAQCTHDFRVRAVARCDRVAVCALTAAGSGAPGGPALFRSLVGDAGRITVTVEAEEKSLRYQGIVPLSGGSLAESLEVYFASSEQLPTRVLLAADETDGAGMLVQKLPGAKDSLLSESSAVEEAWAGAQRGIAQLGPGRLREPDRGTPGAGFSGARPAAVPRDASAIRMSLQRGSGGRSPACTRAARGARGAEGAGLGDRDVRVLSPPLPLRPRRYRRTLRGRPWFRGVTRHPLTLRVPDIVSLM